MTGATIIDPFAPPKGKWWPFNLNGIVFSLMMFIIFLAWILCIDYGLALAYITWAKLSTKEARFGWMIGLLVATITASFLDIQYSAHKTVRIYFLVMLSMASAVIIIFLIHSNSPNAAIVMGLFSVFSEVCLILILGFQLRPAIFCSINMTWLFLEAMLLNLTVLSWNLMHLRVNPRYLEPLALFTINILAYNPSRFLLKSDFFKTSMITLTGSIEPFSEDNTIYTPPRQHKDTRPSLNDGPTRWCGYCILVSTILVTAAFACTLSLPFLGKDLGTVRIGMQTNFKILMVACGSVLAFGSTCIGKLCKIHIVVWFVISILLTFVSLLSLIKLIEDPAGIPFGVILASVSCLFQVGALFFRELKTATHTQGWISCALLFCSLFIPIAAPLVCEYKL
ncbi:envelope protein UL43 [Gallid alphaherpesvirus 1]|uniref:Envelope protein UL43 n=1 Tax=Infectious laryngotracheitis virus TaxID=10386 RepID=S4UZU7_ILTV|nr:envelope protein UL43 [Gallid alphaherpesvirus 1]ANB43623.1 envelope protein UL43 [Gallid alphaherpesvirus 1]QAA96245.1 envelope protein UL43 [Gallid alphaherpesvirus 1]QHW06133.1 envelope protein UL43 [Gallid alphaherpesvirus 1]WRQ97426.1 envelope protein UL43 [Gallid alphaherpesvirus 1]